MPENSDKYVGKYPITYRSTWELAVMRLCDHNPNILEWASEPLQIPYYNEVTMKNTIYVPDFIVKLNKSGTQYIEMWEIKPLKETMVEHAKSEKNKLSIAINACKWKAASAWCARNGMTFRVITENMLFRNYK